MFEYFVLSLANLPILNGFLLAPPVGLNLYIIKGITPDVSLSEILKGSIPFMIIMALAILILCIFPEIVTWLPDKIMGKSLGF